MKIAVYYDVPFGGAHMAMKEILALLKKNNQVTLYKNKNTNHNGKVLPRLFKDFNSIVLQRFKQKSQAVKIDNKKYDLVFVSHDRHFQAPWILRYLKTPTVFLCQEPTRAFFENFLKINLSWPILNRLYEKVNRSIRKNIEIKNASFAKRIISNSVYSQASILKAYKTQSTPMYMGVNTNNFYYQKVKRNNQVVTVGNNEPQKNLPLAILSVGKIAKKIRPKLVVISPRHRQNDELFTLARTKKVDLIIKEGVTVSEVRETYNKSLCLLAVAKLEPFGMSVIESLACRTPVVAIDEGGFKETVINNKTGYLVKAQPSQISKAITKLIQSPNRRNKMGIAGEADVKKRFSWPKIVNNLESVFHEIA